MNSQVFQKKMKYKNYFYHKQEMSELLIKKTEWEEVIFKKYVRYLSSNKTDLNDIFK